MRELSPDHRLRHWTLGLAALTLTLAALPAASAHSQTDEHGTLTAHDEEGGPVVLDVPDCTVHFKAVGLREPHGVFTLSKNFGRGGAHEVYRANVTATPDGEGGYTWTSGAITVDGTHERYLAEIAFNHEKYMNTDLPAHYQQLGVFIHCGRPYVGCVQHIQAEAIENGHVRLTWSAAHNATGYRVTRYVDDLPNGAPDFDTLGETAGREFIDTTSKPGETHWYRIDAIGETGGSSGACRVEARVTAVPFFGAPLFGALALVGTVGAYAFMRRR